MKKIWPILLLGMFAWSSANAAAVWFTIVGDFRQPEIDTVQVDVDSAVQQGDQRVVNIRVNRKSLRTAYDDAPYRSYVSSVVIDCDRATATHSVITLFSDPLLQGEQRTLRFPSSSAPSMAFADMDPNPNTRIIRAACAIASVRTR